MTDPNPMLVIPTCSLDGKHISNIVLEYILINNKLFPLYGSWYCLLCKKRLDDIPYNEIKHERFREIQRVPTERHLEKSDNID